MKLTFQKGNLLYALQVLQGVASGRTTLPILSNVLIRAKEDEVELAATDLEIGIIMKVEAVVHEEGAITVSAKKLGDIVKELPEGQVDLVTTANDRIEMTCGKGVYKLIGLSEDEFPDIPTVEGDLVPINGDTLRSVLYKTEYAASTEEVRYFLNGLFFNFLEDRTEVVATDGKRLALSHFEPVESLEDTNNFIVPLKAVREILRTFGESPEIKVSALENQILFTDGTATLTSRLVEGDYPKYNKIIPEETDNRVIVSREDILKATRRVSLLSNPKNYMICMDIGQDRVQMFTRTPELGEAHENVSIGAIEDGGTEIKIGFDARLLEQALSHIESSDLAIEFSSALNPVLIKPVGAGNHISLVMPMRLDKEEGENQEEDQENNQEENG